MSFAADRKGLEVKARTLALVLLFGLCAHQSFGEEPPPADSSKAPYLLSGSERTILTDKADRSEANNNLLRKALTRVIDSVVVPGFTESMGPHDSMVHYFIEAATRSDNALTFDQDDRYRSGWTFQRHAGFFLYYTIVDLKTGEIVLASSAPGVIKLAFKTCVSEEFKRYANHRVHKWLYDAVIESMRKDNGGKLPPDMPPENDSFTAAQEFTSPCEETK